MLAAGPCETHRNTEPDFRRVGGQTVKALTERGWAVREGFKTLITSQGREALATELARIGRGAQA